MKFDISVVPTAMDYRKSLLSGLSWSFATRWVNRGLTFIRLFILARLLTPAQFGIFGIATLVLALLEIFTETWINVFLVQQPGHIGKYLDTAWVISLARGALIGLAILVSAPLVSAFFSSPGAYPLLVLTALVPFVRGFINPAVVIIQKQLQFKKELSLQVPVFLTETIMSIIICFIIRSPLGLVLGMILGALLEVGLTWVFFTPRPAFSFNRPIASHILTRSKWITAAGIFNYLYQHGDDILVGRLLGESPLGLYQSAYKISSLPLTEIGDVFAKVSFPLYVRLLNQAARLRRAFVRVTTLVSVLTVMSGGFLFLFARPAVLILLGPAWVGAIPALQVLSLYGIAKSLVGTAYPLFLARDKQEYITAVTLASLIGLGLTIIPLISHFGLVGAGLSAVIGSLLSLPLAVYLTLRLLK